MPKGKKKVHDHKDWWAFSEVLFITGYEHICIKQGKVRKVSDYENNCLQIN